MSLSDQVNQEIADALRRGDRRALGALRLLKASAQNSAVAKRRPLTDDEYLDAVRREVKLHGESAEAFARAGDDERAEEEREQVTVLERYLPPQMSDDDLRATVGEAIDQMNPDGPQNLGALMARVMPIVDGRADGRRVSAVARELLAGSRTD